MINPGKLKERIKIITEHLTPDGMGGQSRQWVEAANVWALVQPKLEKEQDEAGQLQHISEVYVTIRLSGMIKQIDFPYARFVWKNQMYDFIAEREVISQQSYVKLVGQRYSGEDDVADILLAHEINSQSELLQENGFRILQENGAALLFEENNLSRLLTESGELMLLEQGGYLVI